MLLSGLKDRIFYGWVMVATFCIAGSAIWGIRFSFGVFFKSLESEFALNRATTSAIFSAFMVLGTVFSVVGGWALDRFGPRIVFMGMGICTGISLLLTGQVTDLWQIFFTYSLLLAIGTSAVYVVIMSTVSRWFEKKRGLALGMASIGAGMGPLVVAPFATYLISAFDWRGSFTVLGVIALVLVTPLSLLLRRNPQEVGLLPDGAGFSASETVSPKLMVSEAYLTPRQAVRTRSFWLMLSSFLIYSAYLLTILTHLVPHITDLGFSAAEAAAVLSIAGGSTIVGRVFLGMISDRMGKKKAVILGAALHIIALLFLLWARDLWMFYIFAVIFGFGWGGMGPATAALIGDTFGLGRLGAILGLLDVGFNIGAAIGPVVAGLIYDLRQSYFLSFLMGIGLVLATMVVVFFVRRETDRTAVDS